MNRAEVRKKYKEKNKDKQENNSESNEEKPYIRKKDREKKEEVNGSEQNPILRRRERILGKVKQEEKTEVTYGTKSFKSKWIKRFYFAQYVFAPLLFILINWLGALFFFGTFCIT